MDEKLFYKLCEFIDNSRFTQQQAMTLKLIIERITITNNIKKRSGYHLSEYAGMELDRMIEDGVSFTECMKVCNVSKTTVLRHRKKVQKQLEEREAKRQEILSRDDNDIERKIQQVMDRISDGLLPF